MASAREHSIEKEGAEVNKGLNVFNRRTIRSYEARSISEPDLRRIYDAEADETGGTAAPCAESAKY